MHIDVSKLPTHVAQVGRRLNVVAPDELAATFLEASYLAEVAIKTIALVLLAGVRERIPDHAYRISHSLVRADGLGTWESEISELALLVVLGQRGLRRAVEEEPFNKRAWLERATFAAKVRDESTRIASLVSAVDADPKDVELIREVAFLLSQYVNDHLFEIPKARRGVYLASVRAHMEKVASALDATGLSRLAWLFLLEDNVEKARKYANDGCAKDPINKHCLGILERIEREVERA